MRRRGDSDRHHNQSSYLLFLDGGSRKFFENVDSLDKLNKIPARGKSSVSSTAFGSKNYWPWVLNFKTAVN